jgi:hypothetical protein
MGEKFSNSYPVVDNAVVPGENSYFIHSGGSSSAGVACELTSTATPFVEHYLIPSDYYPPCYVSYPAWPVVENKIEKAFKIAKMLIKDDYVHFSSVEKFIKLVENLKETL